MFGQAQTTDRSDRGDDRARARKLRRAALLGSACAVALAPTSMADPNGGVVVAGDAAITGQGGLSTAIDQTSQRAIINWDAFSVAADGSVTFRQPGADSITLNRVVGQDPSSILGQITANGRVVLVNPNGVLFGANSRIDVGSLIATTHDIANDRFMAGDLTFDLSSGLDGFVVNEGLITVSDAGLAAFVAPHVRNSGIISARLGTVALGAASKFTVDFYGDQLITFPIDAALLGAPTASGGPLAVNDGVLRAEGGAVLMTASAARGVVDDVLLAGGEIVATSFSNVGGRIVLHGGDAGSVRVAGSLDASGVAGGSVSITGESVLADGAVSANGTYVGGAISVAGDWVSVGGSLAANGGSGGRVDIAAGGLSLAGGISATGTNGAGGAVDIAVTGKSYEFASASIDVSGAVGGRITDTAGQQLTTSASYDASGSSGAGGRIDLSASALKLLSANLDASGATGGRVRLGGEYQGGAGLSVDELANAATLVASDGTRIDVSAHAVGGRGGEAIIWSDDHTVFLGAVDARPGAGGAGGFVEVSSKGVLDFNADIQTGGGNVLLDPKFLTVVPDDYDQLGLILGFNYDGSPAALDAGLAEGDSFGFAVSMDANRLAVGALGVDSVIGDNTGAVFLFTFGGADYTSPALASVIGHGFSGPNLRALTLTEAAGFGDSVSLDGTRLAVGAPSALASNGGSPQAGAAYLFSFADNAFNLGQLEAIIGNGYNVGKDLSVPIGQFKNFGTGIALDGGRLAVGAGSWDGVGDAAENSGAVLLFTFDEIDVFDDLDLAYTLGYPEVPNLSTGHFFGRSVALDGDWMAVGAIGDVGAGVAEGFTGAAYLFSFTDGDLAAPVLRSIIGNGYTTNTGVRQDISVDAIGGLDFFGASIALDVSTGRLAVGAPLDDGANDDNFNTGAVYLFDLDFTGGSFAGGSLARIIGSDHAGGGNISVANAGEEDLFGEGLDLDGDRLVVGAPGDDGALDGLGDSGAVYFYDLSLGGGIAPGSATFANEPGATSFLRVGALLALLNGGNTVTLSANSDITVTTDILVTAGGAGGDLALEAGRSLIFAAGVDDLDGLVTIDTDGGDLTLTANQTLGAGVVDAHRDPGDATIDLTNAIIDAGAGTFTARILADDLKANGGTGALTLGQATAGNIVAEHLGLGNVVLAGDLTATGGGDAIVIRVHDAAGGFLNAGAFALNPGGGRFVVFSTDPDQNVIGGLGGTPWYNTATDASLASVPAGQSRFAYSLAPTLTITADDFERFYGDANPALFNYVVTGLVGGDTLGGALSGTPGFTAPGSGANAGLYVDGIVPNAGLLNSLYNYQLAFAPGTLTITPRPITVTARSDLEKIYGDADPALLFDVTLGNLVGADALAGTLARDAGENVGGYTVTQGDVDSLNNPNYDITFENGLLTITPRPITVTARSDLEKIYGDADPALLFDVTLGNLVGGDALAGTLERDAGENVGGYTVTQGDVDSLNNPNYDITFENGLLTITPRPITVTARSDLEKIYGNADPALLFDVTLGNLVGADALAGTLARDAGENVGGYTVTQGDVDNLNNPNYAITFENGLLTINQRPITVSADDLVKIYGDANPTLTFGNSDLGAGAAVAGTLGTPATPSSGIGDYAITIGDLVASNPNYSITLEGGLLTINRRPITVTADDLARLYGAANPTLTFSTTSLGAGAAVAGSLATVATPASAVGGYAITQGTVTNATNPNYLITYVAGTLTVGVATLLVDVDDASREYGLANPAFSATITGFVNGDDAGVLLTGPSFNTAATASSNVGDYLVTASGATAANYVINYATGTLTIDPASLLINVNDATREYGDANPAFSATFSGFRADDDASNLLTAPVFATAATTGSGVGDYAITGSGATAQNYVISYADGALTVTPATLLVTGDDATREYGDADPAFSGGVTGFKLGEDASVVSGLSFASTATLGSNVGAYDINGSGATADNYVFQYAPGTLTITPAALLIAANDASRVYGDANPTFTATFTGFKAGDDAGDLAGLSFATPATSSSNVGDYALTASGATSQNYIISYADPATLTITPALLTVVVNDAQKVYGDANPAFSATITGFKLGDTASVLTGLALSTGADADSEPGDYAITSSGGVATNYVISQRTDGVLTIFGGQPLETIVGQVENDASGGDGLEGSGGGTGSDFAFANDVGSTGEGGAGSGDATNLICVLAEENECPTAGGGAE
jgi:filamentous hemagglutinin family protein